MAALNFLTNQSEQSHFLYIRLCKKFYKLLASLSYEGTILSAVLQTKRLLKSFYLSNSHFHLQKGWQIRKWIGAAISKSLNSNFDQNGHLKLFSGNLQLLLLENYFWKTTKVLNIAWNKEVRLNTKTFLVLLSELFDS